MPKKELRFRGHNMAQNIQDIYKNLTAVDIESQKRLWDERGKGYYGEYLVFSRLYQSVSGTCKILMNLNVPATASQSTEIDLVMIHETGLYVFEIKHYKGTIYGKYGDEQWTQYFRTVKNSHFNSPVYQNNYHIQALQKLVPNVPVHSFIVFTNDSVELKVTDWESTGVVICKLQNLKYYLDRKISSVNSLMSIDKIDEIFRFLERYSPVKDSATAYDGEVVSLDKYAGLLKRDYEKNIGEIRRKSEEELEKAKQGYDEDVKDAAASERRVYHKKIGSIAGGFAATAALIALCAIIIIAHFGEKKREAEKAADAAKTAQSVAEKARSEAENAQASAEAELAEFQKNFKHVEYMNGGDVQLCEDFLTVTDLELRESEDLQNTVLFSCGIQVNGEEFGLYISNRTKYIVQLKDGTALEYSFLEALETTYISVLVGNMRYFSPSAILPGIRIFNASIEDIDYIKLSGVAVLDAYDINQDRIPGIEFELYSAE